MIVGGVTDSEPHVGAIARKARSIRPDRIQLNTPVRPSSLGGSAVVSPERLRSFRRLFSPEAEVVAGLGGPSTLWEEGGNEDLQGRLLALLGRRPCTVEDAGGGLSVRPNVVVKVLGELEARGAVRREAHDGRLFFVAKELGGER
jgi:hypothetical protein